MRILGAMVQKRLPFFPFSPNGNLGFGLDPTKVTDGERGGKTVTQQIGLDRSLSRVFVLAGDFFSLQLTEEISKRIIKSEELIMLF